MSDFNNLVIIKDGLRLISEKFKFLFLVDVF